MKTREWARQVHLIAKEVRRIQVEVGSDEFESIVAEAEVTASGVPEVYERRLAAKR